MNRCKPTVPVQTERAHGRWTSALIASEGLDEGTFGHFFASALKGV